MRFEHLVHNARQHPSAVAAGQRERLAAGQQPVALFITCSDSRVIPAQITGAEPGQLFELRTAGNVVPKYAPDSASSEMATIEYAVLQLAVPEIIVCGHSHCGAVSARLAAGEGLDDLPALRTWLGTDGLVRQIPEQGPADPGVRAECQEHLRQQVRTLAEYPFVRDRLEAGKLRLHGWLYELDTGRVLTCSPDYPDVAFQPL